MSRPTEWFWVLTVTHDVRGGQGIKHYHGTWTQYPGATRADVFEAVTQEIFTLWRQESGSTVDPMVLFWSLEPNDLT